VNIVTLAEGDITHLADSPRLARPDRGQQVSWRPLLRVSRCEGFQRRNGHDKRARHRTG
jgi:hypothetical protein